ncbi:MAG: disulfide oxidoreductase [Pyrinomonadaceae bacterium]
MAHEIHGLIQEDDKISLRSNLNRALPYLAWFLALSGTVGSLFFSEVMQYPPCVLCWYQRIALYPLVLIIGIGIVTRDNRMKYYALPLCVAGSLVSIYHNLLYYGVIPDNMTPCTQGVPCNSIQIEWLGFITIPFMSLLSFIAIGLCLLLKKPEKQKK